jgi:hypothetical protein
LFTLILLTSKASSPRVLVHWVKIRTHNPAAGMLAKNLAKPHPQLAMPHPLVKGSLTRDFHIRFFSQISFPHALKNLLDPFQSFMKTSGDSHAVKVNHRYTGNKRDKL